MAYEWKYFPVKDDAVKELSADPTIMQKLDAALADLKERKGALHTSFVELFVEIRFLNLALESDKWAVANSRVVARFATMMAADKWGRDKLQAKLSEFMEDADTITASILKVDDWKH